MSSLPKNPKLLILLGVLLIASASAGVVIVTTLDDVEPIFRNIYLGGSGVDGLIGLGLVLFGLRKIGEQKLDR